MGVKAKFPVSEITAVGRRKTAIAQATFKKSKTAQIFVNKKTLEKYFPLLEHQLFIQKPLTLIADEMKQKNHYEIILDVRGGGKTAQAEAARLAIARVLDKEIPNSRAVLKKAELLRRDSRIVERKKYGLHKARRGTQFSKR